MSYLQSQLVPGWRNTDPVSRWQLHKKYIEDARSQGQNVPQAIQYTHGLSDTIRDNCYAGGVFVPGLERIYLAPYGQGDLTTWHYINTKTGAVVPYTVTAQQSLAYIGAVLDQKERVWFIPFAQSGQTSLRYIDTKDQSINSLAITALTTQAYADGVFVPSLNRIYMAPHGVADESTWHYINTVTPELTPYSHSGTSAVDNAYRGAVLAPNNRVYFIPYAQAPETNWHYVDLSNGSVVAYTQNSGVTPVLNGYIGGVLAPNGRIYLIPNAQSTETQWHYIDTNTGNVVVYTHGATVAANGYSGGVLAPDGRIYLIPKEQSYRTIHHYIDTLTGNVVAYNVTSAVDSSTKLLLHGNGTNGSTNIIDEVGHTVSPQGDAHIDTSQSKFGGASITFDGNDDYLIIPDSSEWTWDGSPTSIYTVEFWIRFRSVTDAKIIGQWGQGGQLSWLVKYSATNGRLEFWYSTDGNTQSMIQRPLTPVVNTWYHLAWQRTNTSVRTFINGNLIEQGITTSNFFNSNLPLWIGRDHDPGNHFNGWLDEIRLLKGSCPSVGSNFTPLTEAYSMKCSGGVLAPDGRIYCIPSMVLGLYFGGTPLESWRYIQTKAKGSFNSAMLNSPLVNNNAG